ncbi:porin family protein [Chryseobacterium sp. 3008163]|uniref:porin family protein n=1 Tax=Chryseobacterium sp. 3008163 TaxID=2478663 RepID=UPI000F0C86E8|nr:porin family protein [Chryseobacterium sp. 3008163]AYN02376.1 PorT family protein [Chryseobacterium sp. 3008163]
MKKLFLGLAVVAGSFAFAQEVETISAQPQPLHVKEPVRFGIKGAATATQFSEQELNGKNQKIGFNAGVFVNIPLSEKFALQPEVLYNQMGAKSVVSDTEIITGATSVRTKTDFTTSLNYVSVPLMLQMKPSKNFYIEAGPEFSYFVDGKNKGEQTIATTTAGNTVTQTQSSSESINKDDIKKFNVGLGLGLGYYFTPNLGINARYVNSLTHIANNSDAVNDAQKNINTNRGFQLGLAYKF